MLVDKIDLSGTWQFREYPRSARRMRDLDDGDWLETRSPHSIYAALVEAGRIDRAELLSDPQKFLGVSQRPWIFRKEFEVGNAPAGADRVELVCEGLDTVAQVWLNEKLIARTDNMFLIHRFDVTGVLRSGPNTLLVKFTSPLEAADQRMSRYGRLNVLWGMEQRVWLRKAQFQFGCPYGPALPGCGIVRPVRIEAHNGTRIRDLYIRTIDCTDQYADLRIAVDLEVLKPAAADLSCELEIARGPLRLRHRASFEPRARSSSAVIRIDRPDLWRPRGYGEPALYDLTARLMSGSDEIDHREMQFGIRTIQCSHESDAGEKSFRFVVNDQPVFIRGVFRLPDDLFLSPLSQEELERQLCEFAESGGNFVRLWAGGGYESGEFYRLCDRLGLLVWQDFAFAEAYYPERRWFLDAVQEEADQLIRRLRNHPSLALWCGNENIDALHRAGKLGGGRKFHGREIFHRLLPALVRRLDPDREYISTTPSAAGKAKSSRAAIVHWDGDPQETLPAGAGVLVAKAGVPSLPSLESLRSLLPRLSGPDDPALDALCFAGPGPAPLLCDCIRLFGIPRSVEDLILQSQLLQARRFSEQFERLCSAGHTGGLILNSWNDFWPAAGPGAYDRQGIPRALAFYLKRCWKPVRAMLAGEPFHWTHAVALNDGPSPLAAILKARLMTLDGTLLDRYEMPVTLAPHAAAEIKLPRELLCPSDPSVSFLLLEIEDGRTGVERSVRLFRPDREIHWGSMDLDCRLEAAGPTTWKITIESPTLVKDLIVIPPRRVRLSDNFFDLLPRQSCEVLIDFEDPAPQMPPLRLRSSAFSQTC